MATITKNLGPATAYGYAKEQGYTGTEEEFAELMARQATVAEEAAASADAAAASERNAQASEQNAAASASTASDSAATANTKASEAESSASSAASSAATASSKASEASASATAAAQSASSAASASQNAASSAQSAESSATDAEQAKTDAQDAKEAAEAAQAAAEQAKDDAVAAADRAEQAESEVLSAMDGTYENLTSGNAQQLLSTVTEANSVPYLFRPTAANADRAYLDEVVGGTVAWNQLAYKTRNNNTDHGVTLTANGDGKYTLNGTAEGAAPIWTISGSTVSGHVYYHYLKSTGNNVKLFRAGYTATMINNSAQVTKISTADPFSLIVSRGDTVNNEEGIPQIFDLTILFGSTIADYIYNLEQTTAGAGVAYFRKLFPKNYYEYNAGELLSVNTSQHKMVGFNAWDEEWEKGSINDSGVNTASTSTIRSKNYIRVVAGATYYFYCGSKVGFFIFAYDADKTFISKIARGTGIGWTYTIPEECAYIRFRMYDPNYGTTYHHDICINLSDPTRNGTYEPYNELTYPLDSSLTLRGIPKLDASGNLYYDGDTYAADGTVERKYGIVDLGTLTWNRAATSESGVYRYESTSLASLIKKNAGGTSVAADWIITTKYQAKSLDKVYGKSIGIAVTGSGNICIYDSDFTSGSFATFVSGVYLVYELSTPTTETAEPYRHLQICDPNGTEEFVSTSIVPVGHNTRYPENLRAKIEGLPWNFNSIIAMTETTTTASKAYSVGDYFILNNVLYRVTSAIASGGTITIGTNCRATTIMDEIKALS